VTIASRVGKGSILSMEEVVKMNSMEKQEMTLYMVEKGAIASKVELVTIDFMEKVAMTFSMQVQAMTFLMAI